MMKITIGSPNNGNVSGFYYWVPNVVSSMVVPVMFLIVERLYGDFLLH